MFCLGNRDHSVIFKTAFFKHCISDFLFEYDGYSISSKGFLPFHMWNRSPVQVQCMWQGTQGWCTGTTLRDGMWREVGEGFRTGDTCTPMADSCQCMAKPLQYYKVIQFSSVAQSCPTVCDPMDCSTPGLPVHHQLPPEFTQTHVHWVRDAIQPSHPLSSPSPPTFNLAQHQGVFKWVRSLQQVAKVLEFQFQHQSFQWIFRTDFL